MAKNSISMKIDTRELARFEKDLLKLPNQIATRVLQSAVTSSIRPAAKAIRAAAPRGSEESWAKTGETPANEKYGKLSKNIKIGKARGSKNQRSAVVNTGKAFWGIFVEYGTRFMPARPWFAKAFESAWPAMIAALEKNLDAKIKQAWDKLGSKK